MRRTTQIHPAKTRERWQGKYFTTWINKIQTVWLWGVWAKSSFHVPEGLHQDTREKIPSTDLTFESAGTKQFSSWLRTVCCLHPPEDIQGCGMFVITMWLLWTWKVDFYSNQFFFPCSAKSQQQLPHIALSYSHWNKFYNTILIASHVVILCHTFLIYHNSTIAIRLRLKINK